jgi:hypothetical protein
MTMQQASGGYEPFRTGARTGEYARMRLIMASIRWQTPLGRSYAFAGIVIITRQVPSRYADGQQR